MGRRVEQVVWEELAKSAETMGMKEPLKDGKWFVSWLKLKMMWQLGQRLVRKDGIWVADKKLPGGSSGSMMRTLKRKYNGSRNE